MEAIRNKVFPAERMTDIEAVYRRKGWDYGVIALATDEDEVGAAQRMECARRR